MKRLLSRLSALSLGLMLLPAARADIPYDGPYYPRSGGSAGRYLLLIALILVLLAVTALLVRHFSRKK